MSRERGYLTILAMWHRLYMTGFLSGWIYYALATKTRWDNIGENLGNDGFADDL